MVQELVKKECVQELHTGEYGFFSRVFLVPKQSGGWRLVIDLCTLNEYLTKVTFCMDTLMHVKEAARQGMWATSLDFSDAYHRVPIHPDSQIYLCFQVGDKRFRYLVLPFGLSTAPWVFTEVVKQVKVWSVAQLRVLFQYLDDCLNLFKGYDEALRGTKELVDMCIYIGCMTLGLLINQKKSELTPVKSIVFLGERLDFTRATTFPTQARQDQVFPLLNRALAQMGLPFNQAESLLGLLGATASTVPLGRLHLRRLQWQVIHVIRKGRDPKAWVSLTQQTAQDLRWWLHPQLWQEGIPFQLPPPEETVYTDASTRGWG